MTLNDWKTFGKAVAIRIAAFTCIAFAFYHLKASLGAMLLGGAGILVALMLYRTREE